MVWKLRIRQGKRVRQQVPFMPDLLFVYDSRKVLDPLVERIATLQYRFVKGGNHQPMTVRNADMERFIRAVDAMNNPCFYTPEEINPDMLGKRYVSWEEFWMVMKDACKNARFTHKTFVCGTSQPFDGGGGSSA